MTRGTFIFLRGDDTDRSLSSKHFQILFLEGMRPKRISGAIPKTSFDYLLLTSARSIWALKRLPKAARIVVIGPKTAQSLPGPHRKKCLVVRKSNREGVVELFKKLPKGKMFFPRSALADSYLPRHLRRLGFQVSVRKVYTMELTLRRAPFLKAVDSGTRHNGVVFGGLTSISSVKALRRVLSLKELRQLPVRWIAIGSTTSKVLKRLRWPHVVSPRPSLEAMVETARKLILT